MSEEMRLIFTELKQMDSRFIELDSKIKNMDSRFIELDSKIKNLDSKFIDLDSKFENLDSKIEKVQEETTRIRITMENDISKKIDIIGEGHDFLKESLNQALKMESKREQMELDIVNLNMDVKKIKQHCSIA